MMTYVVSYANLGNAPAEGVVVTVTFDPELICPDGVECSQTMSFELGTVDRGGSGQIPVRWRLPQVGACHPGLSGGLGKVLASTACISTSSVEPARVRSNNCFTDRLPVLCCQFFVEVHYARENYY